MDLLYLSKKVGINERSRGLTILSDELKQQIKKDLTERQISLSKLSEKYNISVSTLSYWRTKNKL